MNEKSLVLNILNIISYFIILVISLIHWIVLISFGRSRQTTDLSLINFCFTVIFHSIFWIFYYLMLELALEFLFDNAHCTYLYYGQSLCTCQVTYSFMLMTLNRYLIITQPTNRLFHSCRWIMTCILCQWLIGLLLPLPLLARNLPVSKTVDSSLCHHDAGLLIFMIFACFQKCAVQLWIIVYERIVAIAIPSFVAFIIHLSIFNHMRSSTHRINYHLRKIRIHVIRHRHRDLHLLRHSILMYLLFLVGWTPIALIYIIDHQHVASLVIYAGLHLVAELFSLIIIIQIICLNKEVKDYLTSKLLCFNRC